MRTRGRRRPPADDALNRLDADLDGTLIRPGDPDYALHRAVWNGSIDRRPALIVRCAGVADVQAAVRFARETDLEIAVRSGGHSFPGLSVVDDGVVIDLGAMKGVEVDAEARTARVRAGVLLGEMDRATQAVGMAVPTGAVTHTGVAGLTLGGGIGWLMRKHGLAIDQLRAADLVTADGEVVRVSEEQHPELFWGIRGGGGNFGIVTDFEFALNPVGPTVLSVFALWPFEHAEGVSRYYREWSAAVPEELTTALVMRRAPALDIVPEHLHGQLVVGVVGCWAGPLEEGLAVVGPMRAFGSSAVDLTAPRPFVEHQGLLDASFPHGVWVYMKACDVVELTDEVIDVSIEHAGRAVSPRSSVIAWQLGGRVAEMDGDATAFGSRDAGFIFNISGITDGPEDFEQERTWVRDFFDALIPYQTSVYVNFLMEGGEERVREAYGAQRYDRLRALKASWDPENVFHLNQNIPPA